MKQVEDWAIGIALAIAVCIVLLSTLPQKPLKNGPAIAKEIYKCDKGTPYIVVVGKAPNGDTTVGYDCR